MYDLLKKARDGSRESLEILTQKNAGLVYSIASRFDGRGYDIEDLRQIGMMGLIKAVRRFDTSYNVKFSTYAVPVIAGEIKRFLRDDGIIKVSRRYKELSMAAKAAAKELGSSFMREPTLKEIADKLGVDIYTLTEATEACMPCDSIYRTVSSEGGEVLLMDKLMGDDDSSLADRAALRYAMQSLDERSRSVIAYRYFMDETQTNVAMRLGISQVQVSRIEKKALCALKGMLNSEFG